MCDTRKRQKRLAVINDFTGFGRCSLTVSIPVISQLGVQCCPVPTSIFSNHTAFPSFYFEDYTEKMPAYIAEWKKLNLTFDGIQIGFLGSHRQISVVQDFIRSFRSDRTLVLVDPVMGDNGTPYALYDEHMQAAMRQLAAEADILTPNLTEACILTSTPYRSEGWTEEELFTLAGRLTAMGAQKVVISGIPMGQELGNVLAEKGQTPQIIRSRRVGTERCGTGDIFSSILAADAVNGVSLGMSVRKAADFISECILITESFDTPLTDGVCFEEILHKLRR
ncbi:MAG TPA: pyridoxamine kinase [Candidatus Fusicatenibacter merdavium]|uniref:pyridoxal kinase n=1 Tax=Candidatus Fusicatenibacter merdavium TaxID=2838600 RepID=A0A9D2BJ59_9FIRM|nr:pyridoxamine kinase [Candidatus Fusicatenibacter merdavium]